MAAIIQQAVESAKNCGYAWREIYRLKSVRVEICKISLEATLPLRQRLLRSYLTVDGCRFPSDNHPQACHFGVFDGDTLVGICTIAPESLPNDAIQNAWRLRMMATDNSVRKTGVGKQLLQAAEQHVKIGSAHCLWCNARESALEFYRKQGYVVISDKFEMENIGPHYRMIKYFIGDFRSL